VVVAANKNCLGRRPFAKRPPAPALIGVLFALCGVACADSIIIGHQDRRLANGPWGGEHIALTVTDAGAHVEFDCASGDITRPLVVDDKGHMVLDGVYIPERIGPVHVGDAPDARAARYDGQLDGEKLTLDVVLKASKEVVGHFAVTHGAEARVRKCR
jgi:hypothetical protein